MKESKNQDLRKSRQSSITSNKNNSSQTFLIVFLMLSCLCFLAWKYIPQGKGAMRNILRYGTTLAFASGAFYSLQLASRQKKITKDKVAHHSSVEASQNTEIDFLWSQVHDSLDAQKFINNCLKNGFSIDKEDHMGVHMTGQNGDLIVTVIASHSTTDIFCLLYRSNNKTTCLIDEGQIQVNKDEIR